MKSGLKNNSLALKVKKTNTNRIMFGLRHAHESSKICLNYLAFAEKIIDNQPSLTTHISHQEHEELANYALCGSSWLEIKYNYPFDCLIKSIGFYRIAHFAKSTLSFL